MKQGRIREQVADSRSLYYCVEGWEWETAADVGSCGFLYNSIKGEGGVEHCVCICNYAKVGLEDEVLFLL